jgi:ribonuclease Z
VKPTFHHKTVNGIFDDPLLYLRLLRERRALLFDAGECPGLSAGELHKVTDVFITHTHIDHFVGFDRLLRINLKRKEPLRLYGPGGITDSIEGKLRGYTWNLIEEYPVTLIVNEVAGNSITVTEFAARNGFRRRERHVRNNSGVILTDPLFTVKTITLTHGIPVLAFSVEEDKHINIDKARLLEKGLTVGPWLSILKKAIRDGEKRLNISVNNRNFELEELRDLAKITEGQKVSYVVDISPTRENIEALIDFVRGSHTLYIEAYFLDEERERAVERNHLTALIAGEIGRRAGVRELVPIHLSPKYRNSPERVIEEALESFRGIRH